MGLRNIFKVKNIGGILTGDEVLLKALIKNEDIDREMVMNIPIVNSSVDFICDTFAMIPFKLYKEEKDGNDNEAKTKVVEVKDERVRIINDDTRDTLDGFQFKKAICEDYLLGKGGYAYINKKGNKFIGLNYVEEGCVSVLTNVNDHIEKSVEFQIDGKTYKDYNILRILRNTKNGASGKGLVNSINKSLKTAYSRIMYENDLMKTCGNKKGFLKSSTKLDEEAMKKLRASWNDFYNGNSTCLILNNGMEFQESSNTSVENQLNEKNKTFIAEMKELFGISNNYDDFIKKSIMPIATAFCTALNKNFLLEKEKSIFYFAPDVTELLKGSLKERYEAYAIAVEKGWMTRNEVRYKEDMNELEGLDVINLGLGSVLLNPKTGTIYTPNTKEEKEVS